MGNYKNRARKVSRKRKLTRTTTLSAEVVSDTAKRMCIDAQTTPPSRINNFVSSSSREKLAKAIERCESHTERKEENLQEGFVMFSIVILKSVLALLCCPSCQAIGLDLEEDRARKQGFAICFLVKCSACLWTHKAMSSEACKVPRKKKNSIEVNIRMALAMRNLGIGYEGIQTFCMHMNMPDPMNKTAYQRTINVLHNAYMHVAAESMKQASDDVKVKEDSSDIAVSFDGTWQKPGHASLNGLVTAIALSTGKVIDFQVKSKKCKGCQSHEHLDKNSEKYQTWKLNHAYNCGTNHFKSSGSMEVDATLEIFQRSVEKNGLRYVQFIGDGDSSTYQGISTAKPYGDGVEIVKKECVGHVQKRVGGRLRNLKSKYRKKKLSDGKGIGGRGRLTDKMIDTMQNYYGLAIRKNKNNLNGMKSDIMAGLYHLASSIEKPQHHLCPEGKNSWCGWQRDKANGTSTYKPKNGLPGAIVEVVKPIYETLSSESLLSRCLDSYTQNPNEAVNNLIWKRCPKKTYQGKKIVEICTASAVTAFNDGCLSIADVLRKCGVSPGFHTMNAIMHCDMKRISVADKQSQTVTKKRRQRLRAIRKGLWDHEKEKEGPVYEPGAF